MAEHVSEQIARMLATPAGRRQTLGRLAAVITGGVLGTAAVTGVDAGNAKKKRCQKTAERCRRDVAAFCGFYYPSDFALCKRDLSRCCKKAGECKTAEAQLCLQNSGW